jgi:hypothetical protein
MEEELVKVHKHFRTVLACATLVATINGGGQLKLFSEHQAEENNLRSLLSFVPVVLVRNLEVIAAVAHGPRPPTSASGAAIGSLHVNIVQDAPVAGPSEQGEPAERRAPSPLHPPISEVTAIANPYVQDSRQGDPYFREDVPGSDYLIVKSGRSHLHSVGDPSKWERYIFEIK